MYKQIWLMFFLLVIPLVACRAQEQISPPEILGKSPVVIRGDYDRGVSANRDHPESPWVKLSGIPNILWFNLNDLSIKNDDGSIADQHFEAIPEIKVVDSISQGDWRVEFKGRFIEREEHFGQGQGLIPNEIRTVHTRKFTGEVYLYLQGVAVLRQHLIETPLDAEYPFRFDYSEAKGLLAFHFAKGKWGDPDSCVLYLYKFSPTHLELASPGLNLKDGSSGLLPTGPIPLIGPTHKSPGIQGVTNVPKKEKR